MANSPHMKINLSGKPKEAITANFLKWSVNIGRIIIVFTELIAMSALIYRFTIDRKIIDLHDEIKKHELLVRAQSAKESDYRSIQNRLESIKITESETQAKIEIMNGILKSIAQGSFSSTNLTVSPNTIDINGVAVSIFPLNNFMDALKDNPNVTSINLNDLSSGDQGIQFKLTIELKQTKRI